MSEGGSRKFDLAIVAVVVAILAGAGGFVAGRFTAPKQLAASTSSNGGGSIPLGGGSGGYGGGGGFRHGGMFVIGTVASVSGDTLSLTTSSGTTATVILTSSTTYMDPSTGATGSVSELTAGTKVAVSETTDSSGNTTADRVIINPSVPSTGAGGQMYSVNGQSGTD